MPIYTYAYMYKKREVTVSTKKLEFGEECLSMSKVVIS